MSLIEIARDPRNNPLDVVEHMAASNSWPFERASEDEIALVVTGRWTNYQVSFTWMSDIEALHLACAFDMNVPEPRLGRGAAAHHPHQRAIVDRAFRRLDAKRRRDVSPCAACSPAASPPRTGNARRCSAPHSIPASAISRRSNSWSGRANRRARRWMPPCSRRLARPRQLNRHRLARARTCVDLSGLLVLVGAGKMGGALLEGWLRLGLDPNNIAVLEPASFAANFRARRGAACGSIRHAATLSRVAAIVIAVKPQMRRSGDASASADGRSLNSRRLDHGRANAAIPLRRVEAPRAHSCAPCRIRRRRSAAASPSRCRCTRTTAQRDLAASPPLRDRHGRMDRGRGVDGRGDRGFRIGTGLCLPARRSAGASRRRGRAAAPLWRKSSRAKPSPARANCCIARRSMPRRCARTSPRRAAPPPPRWRC